MLHLLLGLLLGTFPSVSAVSWMDPGAFHLKLGMTRAQVVDQLTNDGWKTTKGKEQNHLLVEYEEGKTITLSFNKEKLESARFEYVGFIPAVREAFAEQEQELSKKLGSPRKRVGKPTLLTWDEKSPNVTLVFSTARDTSFGRQGLGFLVVRYFLPSRR